MTEKKDKETDREKLVEMRKSYENVHQNYFNERSNEHMFGHFLINLRVAAQLQDIDLFVDALQYHIHSKIYHLKVPIP